MNRKLPIERAAITVVVAFTVAITGGLAGATVASAGGPGLCDTTSSNTPGTAIWPSSTAMAGVALSGSPSVPAQYRVINLGGLSPGGGGEAMAINDRGEVVGYSGTPSGSAHPFLWRHGVMTDLGVLESGSGEYGVAADINNCGEVVGSSDVFGGTAMHGFLWRDGVMTDLGTLGGLYSVATAINDRGQIVGTSSTATDTWHALLWENGRMRDLGVDTVADLNNRGDIVGSMVFPGGYHGYLMRRATLTDLGVLTGGSFSEAHAVNNEGWIVGDADSAAHPNTRGAFLWRNGRMRELPGPAGSTYSSVTTMNDRGQILGQSIVSDQVRPVLWQDGRVIDLTTMGITSDGMGKGAGSLRDIYQFGQIAGTYYFTNGLPGPALFL